MNEIKKLSKDDNYINLMKKQVKELIDLLLEKGYDFGAVVQNKFAIYDPELPKELKIKDELVYFMLSNFTLTTVRFENENLVFDAAFGEDDFESKISVPLFAIVNIIVDNQPIFVNLSKTDSEKQKLEKSKSIFKK